MPKGWELGQIVTFVHGWVNLYRYTLQSLWYSLLFKVFECIYFLFAITLMKKMHEIKIDRLIYVNTLWD